MGLACLVLATVAIIIICNIYKSRENFDQLRCTLASAWRYLTFVHLKEAGCWYIIPLQLWLSKIPSLKKSILIWLKANNNNNNNTGWMNINMACPYRVTVYWKLTTHLNSAFRVHMPSPWYREKSQISCSKDRNTAVEEDGKRRENLSSISSVVAWPSTLHCVAMKSLISLRSSSWVSWCSPLPPLVGISWAFRDFIRASNTADEVLRDPFIQEEELADWPSKWLEDPTWKRYGIHAIKSIPLIEINLQ